MFCRPLRGLCNSEERGPRVARAALAHPGPPSTAAPRLVDEDIRVDSFVYFSLSDTPQECFASNLATVERSRGAPINSNVILLRK